MPRKQGKHDARIDELYQLPLDQFTKRRNELAKELTGSEKSQVKSLQKPPTPVWAINQLYWQDRPTYNALVDASEKLRAAHRSMLSGHKTDLRKPEEMHRTALERALSKVVAIAGKMNVQLSGAALDTIRQSLGALPTDEPAGRLSKPAEPAGFSLLTGIKPRPVKAAAAGKAKHDEQKEERERVERERAEKAKQQAQATAERKLNAARQAAERAASQLKEAERRLAALEKP